MSLVALQWSAYYASIFQQEKNQAGHWQMWKKDKCPLEYSWQKSMPVRAWSIYYTSAREFLSSPCTSSEGKQKHQSYMTSGVM